MLRIRNDYEFSDRFSATIKSVVFLGVYNRSLASVSTSNPFALCNTPQTDVVYPVGLCGA